MGKHRDDQDLPDAAVTLMSYPDGSVKLVPSVPSVGRASTARYRPGQLSNLLAMMWVVGAP